MTTTCGRCGGIVRLDHPACPACGAPRASSSPGVAIPTRLAPSPAPAGPPPSGERLDFEVFARLLAGETPDVVRADLLRKGVRPQTLESVIRKGIERRRNHFRGLGVRNLAKGLGVFLLGVGLAYILIHWARGDGPSRIPVWFIPVSIVAPGWGLLLIFRGIRRIAQPGEGEKWGDDPEDPV